VKDKRRLIEDLGMSLDRRRKLVEDVLLVWRRALSTILLIRLSDASSVTMICNASSKETAEYQDSRTLELARRRIEVR